MATRFYREDRVFVSRATGSVSTGNLSACDVIGSKAREIVGQRDRRPTTVDMVTNGNEVSCLCRLCMYTYNYWFMLVCTFKLNINMIIKRTLQNLNKQNETILSDRKRFMQGINNIINEKLQKIFLKGILDARTIYAPSLVSCIVRPDVNIHKRL